MPAVFPWESSSPILAAILVGSLLAGTLLLVWGHHHASRLLAKLQDDGPAPKVWRAPRVVTRARRTLRWTLALAAAYGLAYALTWVYEPLRGIVWTPALTSLPTVLIIGGTLILASLAREAVGHIDDAVKARAERTGKKPNLQVVHALQLFLRYAIFLAAGAVIIGGILDIFGYQGNIAGGFIAWLTGQGMSTIILLASLIGVGWVGGRLIRATTTEFRYTSKRMSPKVVDAVGGAARGALYAILSIIGLITILTSVGQGQVAGTLVVVLTSFIGITVAMAGTGSIGNMLSGIVLLAFRPVDKGDRVVIADDLVCDVEEVSLMFTRVRNVMNERIDVPNNQVLLKGIKNLSQSQKHAITVRLGIGYDVSHTLVRELAIKAAKDTPGILPSPAPAVYARNLGNYAIDYDLFAFTDDPRHLKTKSDLLGRLQEVFYAAGVEIMTPDVYVRRTGKKAEDEGPVRVAVKGPLDTGEDAPAEPPAPAKR